MTQELKTVPTKGALIGRMAARFGVDEGRLLSTLKATAFRLKDGEVTNEQMMALMVVSDQYQLNVHPKPGETHRDTTGSADLLR